MSTNIKIDVTLQRLQEVAKDTTEKNREDKKAREEDLAIEAKAAELSGKRDGSLQPIEDLVDSLGQPLSRTGDPPSEKQKPNQADKSSVPDTYKKLDVGAGAVEFGFRPVHGWKILSGFNEYKIYSADGTQSIEATERPTFGNPFEDVDFPGDYILGRTSVFSSVELVLPLNETCFVYARSWRTKSKIGYYYFLPPQNGVQQAVSSVVAQSGIVAKCFLVGLSTVKEIQMPGALQSRIDRIEPLPQTVDILLPSTVPSNDTDFFEWLFRPVAQDTIYDQSAAALYSHYINADIPGSATPAIYWYLENYNDNRDREEWLSGSLTPEFIRETYSGATYGANRGNKWYFPAIVQEPATQNQPGSLRVDWYAQRAYDDFSPDTIKKVANYGSFGRARFSANQNYDKLLTAWDVNVSSYCRQQLLALGFSASDLTP